MIGLSLSIIARAVRGLRRVVAGAPAALRASSLAGPSGWGATLSFAPPAGTQPGDSLIMVGFWNAALAGSTLPGIVELTPASWTAGRRLLVSDPLTEVPGSITLTFADSGLHELAVYAVSGTLTKTPVADGAGTTGWSMDPRAHTYTAEGSGLLLGFTQFDGGGVTSVTATDAGHTWHVAADSPIAAFFRMPATAGSAAAGPSGGGGTSVYGWAEFAITGGAGGGGGPAPSGDIVALLAPSRLSGTAPLAVHFAAVGTTSDLVEDPFRQLLYTFDYGDPTSGTWAVSGKSKNSDVGGPLGAHIFDTPGTYTVRVTAERGAASAYHEVTLTVGDPDDVYPGTATVFVSTSGNFTGAPAGAQLLTALPTISSNKRYILRRGENFGGLNIPHGVTGTQVLAQSGGGARPTVSSIQIGTVAQPPNANFPSDIVVRGLTCTGEVTQSSAASRILLLDIEQTGSTLFTLGSALGYYAEPGRYGSTMPNLREMFVVECSTVGNTATFGFTADLIQSAVLGCDFKLTQQHTLRAWGAYQAIIAHNALRGRSSGGNVHALKVHSYGTDPFVLGSSVGAGSTWASRYGVIADNLFSDPADNNAITLVLAPQNGSSAEPLEDFIVENNRFHHGPVWVSDIELAGRRMTAVGNTVVGGGAAAVSAPGLHADGLPVDWRGPYHMDRT